jgi:hypothetical protein
MRSAYSILIGKSEGKITFGRKSRIWEDNIRMDHRGNRVGSCGLDASESE